MILGIPLGLIMVFHNRLLKIANFKEPVRLAMQTTLMLGSRK